ncbi:50S ribosomal protein L29 [Nakamurella aerolata]|uniref:50S ribosomal protein L29 n=1 Tax=Nakamurella aerolata TaxID=1656892 RepID=UPI0031B62598
MSAADELRELGRDELLARLAEAKEELFNLRFQMATGQMDNNRRLRTVRHDIARIYTVLRERELGLSIGPDETAAAGAGAGATAGSKEGAA